MLFLFGGKYRELARLILGIAVVVVGLVIHHGILFVAVGAVLAVWGLFGSVTMFRHRGRASQPGQNSQNTQNSQGGWA